MSGGVTNYPDGVANDGRAHFLPVMLAPELTLPQLTGNDLTWVAGPGGVHGYEPITSINDNGDYPGVSPMSPDALG
jgi:hypothetical protein